MFEMWYNTGIRKQTVTRNDNKEDETMEYDLSQRDTENRITSADGTARIRLASSGHEEIDELVTNYAKKATKMYSDMFLSQLNDGILDGVIKSKITEIVNLCRRAGLDVEDMREACADLIWPVCNYKRFPDLYAEAVNDLDAPRFENVCDDLCYDEEPSADQYMTGKIDGIISVCKDNDYSPTEAAATAVAQTGCDDINFVLKRVKQIYNLT